jgi:hypothetical protein
MRSGKWQSGLPHKTIEYKRETPIDNAHHSQHVVAEEKMHTGPSKRRQPGKAGSTEESLVACELLS